MNYRFNLTCCGVQFPAIVSILKLPLILEALRYAAFYSISESSSLGNPWLAVVLMLPTLAIVFLGGWRAAVIVPNKLRFVLFIGMIFWALTFIFDPILGETLDLIFDRPSNDINNYIYGYLISYFLSLPFVFGVNWIAWIAYSRHRSKRGKV